MLQTAATAALKPPPALPEPQPRSPRPSVPWHCSRRAQALIERVRGVSLHDAELVRRLTRPVIERIKRKPLSPLRPSMLVTFEADWRALLDSECRLALIVDRPKRGLIITDCRISLSANRFGDWPEGHKEAGLALFLVRVQLMPGEPKIVTETLGGISEHAVARFYQRATAPTDAELLGEIQRLVIQHESLIERTPFGCRTPHGMWVGDIGRMRSRGDRVLCVRSFLGPKELKNGR